MNSTALWREVWRDTHTGTAWTLIFTVVASLLIMGLAVADMLTVTRLNQQAQHVRTLMGNVQVLEAPARIDPNACMSLAHQPGVLAAAAVRHSPYDTTANVLPSSSIRTYEATPGIEDILRIPHHRSSPEVEYPQQTGVYLSEDVAHTLGARQGSVIQLNNYDVDVMGVFPWSEEDGRRPGFAYSIFSPTPPVGAYDECWVDVWPLNPNVDPLIRMVALPHDENSQPPKQYPFNQTLGTTFNEPDLYYGRLTAVTPYIGAVVAFALGYVSVWRRRLEYASDLHAGIQRCDLATKFFIETSMWVGATLLLAVPFVISIIAQNPTSDRYAMWGLVATHLTGAASMAPLGTLTACLVIKEKELLRYFKNR